MSLNAYGHKQTNQILDFDERHCINEYKSAYVLRCRSTNYCNKQELSAIVSATLRCMTYV